TRRVKEVPLEDHLDQLAVPDDERPNVEGVLRALGRLPFNQRAALVMRELEGRSYSEIGDTLGVSVAAVETLIFRARRSMRVRASALRSLGAVPLPASLAQLFEGGGVIAGGFGTGFLVKAAVALVAGTLATGLGGDHATRAVAAPPSDETQAIAQSKPAGAQSSPHVVAAERLARHSSAVRFHRAVSATRSRVHLGRRPFQRSASRSSGTTQPSPPSSAPPAAATTAVTQTAETVVGTVENTVSSEAATLPIQAPSLPALPVQPPPLPK